MFDLGWTELLVIGVVALIVVGPKDLPVLFRKAGQFVGKARGMAREFSRAMDQAADESGMKEASASFKKMTSAKDLGLDDLKEAGKSFSDFSPDSETGRLSAQRAEDARKIHEHAARKAEERLKAQAERAEAAKAEQSAPEATKADAQDSAGSSAKDTA